MQQPDIPSRTFSPAPCTGLESRIKAILREYQANAQRIDALRERNMALKDALREIERGRVQ